MNSEFSDEDIDSCVSQFIKHAKYICKKENADLVLYYTFMLKGMKQGNEKDKAIGLKLARKLYSQKVLNSPN